APPDGARHHPTRVGRCSSRPGGPPPTTRRNHRRAPPPDDVHPTSTTTTPSPPRNRPRRHRPPRVGNRSPRRHVTCVAKRPVRAADVYPRYQAFPIVRCPRPRTQLPERVLSRRNHVPTDR